MVEHRCRCFMFASVRPFFRDRIKANCFFLIQKFFINFRLRYTQPDLVRPIRVPLVFPILYLLATVFVTVVPMYASPKETGIGLLMILSSIPVYFVFIAWKNKPKAFQKTMGEYSRFAFCLITSYSKA